MILINKDNVIQVNMTRVYENCIKTMITEHVTESQILMMWLPNISVIDVSSNETIIRLKDEKEDINLGFTGYEWVFDDYINTFYKEAGGEQ